MLQLTILSCAILVVAAAIDDTSVNIFEVSSTLTDELNQINSSLLAMAEAVFKETSISRDITAKISEEITLQNRHMNNAKKRLDYYIKVFNNPEVTMNFSECVQQYNQLENDTQSIIQKISECTNAKIPMFYTQNTYNKTIKIIKLCEEENIRSPEMTMNCYRDARTMIKAMLDSTDVSKWNEISPDESYIQQILTDCKIANNFAEMKIQLLTIDESTEKCISDVIGYATVVVGTSGFFSRMCTVDGVLQKC